jgi:hypothetical protein
MSSIEKDILIEFEKKKIYIICVISLSNVLPHRPIKVVGFLKAAEKVSLSSP